MNDPLLFAAFMMVAVSIGIAIKLLLPSLRARKDASQVGIGEARDAMVNRTTKLVEQRSGAGLQNKLEQSGSQLRSGEWVLLVAATAFIMGALVYLLRGPIAGGMVFVFVPIGAWFLLNRNVTKRQNAFADQLPDLLQNLSSSLRSGQSLPQAIASIAPDLPAPAGDELRRVVIENRIGRDLVESFADLATRMNSIDFDWVVRAIDINYRTGGDLSLILRRLDATIRARNQVAGTVRALSAEGRISGYVLTALPPGVALAVSVINPGFLDPLFTTLIGKLMLAAAVTQLIIGSFWLSRLAKFKF